MKCTKCGKEIDDDSKFCDGCGETIVAETQAAPKKKLSKKLIAIIAVVVAAVILVVSLASGGGDSSSLTVPYENETGAVLNITFDEFTENFGETMDEGFVSIGGNATGFDLSSYWNNMVEPQIGTEESGAEYTLYSAFLTGAHITASVQDKKINTINVGFDYDDNELATTFFATTIMLCGKMTFEESTKICDTVKDGISTNTMVYKDGVLYSVTVSTVSYTVMAASEEFVQRLEDSGNCNVLRW